MWLIVSITRKDLYLTFLGILHIWAAMGFFFVPFSFQWKTVTIIKPTSQIARDTCVFLGFFQLDFKHQWINSFISVSLLVWNGLLICLCVIEMDNRYANQPNTSVLGFSSKLPFSSSSCQVIALGFWSGTVWELFFVVHSSYFQEKSDFVKYFLLSKKYYVYYMLD